MIKKYYDVDVDLTDYYTKEEVDALIPVSYTHLDVYKRQSYMGKRK